VTPLDRVLSLRIVRERRAAPRQSLDELAPAQIENNTSIPTHIHTPVGTGRASKRVTAL
jgi:hypothetical protein